MGKLTSTRLRPPSGSRYVASTAPPSLRTRSSSAASSGGGVGSPSSLAPSSVGWSATPRRFLVPAFFAGFLAVFLAAMALAISAPGGRRKRLFAEVSRRCRWRERSAGVGAALVADQTAGTVRRQVAKHRAVAHVQ